MNISQTEVDKFYKDDMQIALSLLQQTNGRFISIEELTEIMSKTFLLSQEEVINKIMSLNLFLGLIKVNNQNGLVAIDTDKVARLYRINQNNNAIKDQIKELTAQIELIREVKKRILAKETGK